MGSARSASAVERREPPARVRGRRAARAHEPGRDGLELADAAPAGARRSSAAADASASRKSARASRPASRTDGRHDGPVAELAAGLSQRPEVGREVAAVDGGDVARREGRERGGVVPVEDVPGVELERVDRGERVLDARRQLAEGDVAEVAGGHGGEQVEADVGGRGPVGEDALGVLLVVVRRQPVVRGGHEHVEEAPGLARGATEEDPVGGRERPLPRRDGLADRRQRRAARQPTRRGPATPRGAPCGPRSPSPPRGPRSRWSRATCGCGRAGCRRPGPSAARRRSRSSTRAGCARRRRGRASVPMASSMSIAWSSISVVAITSWRPLARRSPHSVPKNVRDQARSSGRTSAVASRATRGVASARVTTPVETPAVRGMASHASTRSATIEGARRLRRRLSRIFQRPEEGEIVALDRRLRAAAPRAGARTRAASRRGPSGAAGPRAPRSRRADRRAARRRWRGRCGRRGPRRDRG